MKILGMGNAIIDVICKVDDKFISSNNLSKGNMKLTFDENEFEMCLRKAPGNKLIEYTTKIQCEVLKIQARIVMDTLVFTGCCVDLKGANSFDSKFFSSSNK